MRVTPFHGKKNAAGQDSIFPILTDMASITIIFYEEQCLEIKVILQGQHLDKMIITPKIFDPRKIDGP